ncbi:MAG: WYL domain-containing protein [Acaryochloris sp. RU_4_1]|nr:WYL domain-containing protein [Acaryochloris sp. RU_4_1]NJR54650.1 WYL domain-containing protein [Acaryochloris sp. CRU_2_0]
MARKRSSITLSIAEPEKKQLERLALEFGQTWGDKPNISKLLKALANGDLRIGTNPDWNDDLIDVLNHARLNFIDRGQLHHAIALSQLLLERSELPVPLRHEIQQFIEHPTHPWRIRLDHYIQQRQPFQLTYQDAAERLWQFTVHHATIVIHEDRQYLDCWCAETIENQDLEPLTHNWSLRLDRIPAGTAIQPVAGMWRSQLDQIPVEFHLLRGLAFAYHTKTAADTHNEWHPDQPQVRRVIRNVTSTFWFFREIRRYGADCVLVGPKEVRERFTQDVRALYQQYFP